MVMKVYFVCLEVGLQYNDSIYDSEDEDEEEFEERRAVDESEMIDRG